MVNYTKTIHQQELTNCLSVFDHFEGLTLNGLKKLPDIKMYVKLKLF